MTTVFIALILLVVAVAAIYLILKNMGEAGVEIAAPGSCKSGRCGVRRAQAEEQDDVQEEQSVDSTDRLR